MNVLRTAIATMVVSTTMSVSIAEARPDTTRMTCNQARDLVRSRGGIVLTTGRSTYDRFVVHRGFCPIGDYIKPAFVRTRDRRSCNIGYTCTMDDPWDWRD